MSIDWTELERLHTAFACTYHPITEDNPEYDRLCGALARSFPAILAERQAMLAKLEAAKRLRDELGYIMEHPVKSMEDGATRFAYIYSALAAFDKEQTE